MGDEPRRRWTYVELDEDVHRELCKQATEQGVRPVDLLEQFITEGIKQKPDPKDWRTRMFILSRDIRERDRNMALLRQFAWRCLQNQSDGSFDTLSDLCNQAGITVEEIIRQVKDLSVEPFSYETDRGVKAAMNWLSENMMTGGEYSASELMSKANADDFTAAVINKAKREMKIKSIKRGNQWVWVK